jgi:hypothetical protein
MKVTRRLTVGVSPFAAAGALLVAAPGQLVQAAPARPATAAAAAVGTGFVALRPTRLLDTRTSATVHTLAAGKTVTVKLAGAAGVPATGVDTVVLNLTGIAKTGNGYVELYPAGVTRPLASTLNLVKGQPRGNLTFAKLGAGGAVTIYASATSSVDLLIDVTGYLRTGSSYTSMTPLRIGDSRNSGSEWLDPGRTRTIHVRHHHGIPDTATSLVFTLTGISTIPPSGTLTVFPYGAARPASPTLYLRNGGAVAQLVLVALDPSGWISVYNSLGTNNMTQDVSGYFTGTADFHPLTAARLLDTSGLATGDNSLQVGGRGGVPAGAGAAVLSVTAVRPDIRGWLNVHPGGSAPSGTTSLNVEAGTTVTNLVVAQLATDGTVEIQKSTMAAGVQVDVVGWLDTAQLAG